MESYQFEEGPRIKVAFEEVVGTDEQVGSVVSRVPLQPDEPLFRQTAIFRELGEAEKPSHITLLSESL